MVALTLPGPRRLEEPLGGRRLDALLSDLGLNPCEVIVTRNGQPLPDDAPVDDGDSLRVIPIVHGG
ncbi:MAG: MoaD/ThiS family protein [Methanospirillum sp.]|nr:MoaD/ThiS family protein [Methanospirillum sp.]